MTALLAAAAAALLCLTAGVATAAERTVTLAVDNMTCVACPYIVREALASVPGVKAAEVSHEKKSAVVTFDDSRASVADLTTATTNAGFPSQLVQ